MDQHSIKKLLLIYLFLSGLLFIGFFTISDDANAEEFLQIAETGSDEEGDDEDDEDC